MTLIMDTELINFLKARKIEIKRQMASLRMELRQIKIAELAIVHNNLISPTKVIRPKHDGPTIKDMIKIVLNQEMTNGVFGATANDIITMIEKYFDRSITRTSISPQLSRLKEGGELILKDNVWGLSSATLPGLRNLSKIEAPEEASIIRGEDATSPNVNLPPYPWSISKGGGNGPD